MIEAESTDEPPVRADRLLESIGIPDLSLARAWMCSRLAAAGVSTDLVRAMRRVPREAFAPGRWRVAYTELDIWTPTGWLLAAPTIARVIDGLNPDWHEVCEFGTGPGYQTAILACIGGAVVSVDHDPNLLSVARRRLDLLELKAIQLVQADFSAELPPRRFDALIINFALSQPPLHLVSLLDKAGGIIAPIATSSGAQRLMRYDFAHGQYTEAVDLGPCRFPYPPPINQGRETSWPRA
jgi:protein-L-isoaspartate(D-aspartate) O-methyltransferase